MEDEPESRAQQQQRGDVESPSDTGAASHTASAPTAATATAAAAHNGHMSHHQEPAGASGELGPQASTADDGSPSSTAATTGSTRTSTTASTSDTAIHTDAATHAGHATAEHKEPISPTDLAASPRSATPSFVAPSSYLRPLAVTRDREEHLHRTGSQPFTASESGAKRAMHPLDREQREGLVSGLVSLSRRELYWKTCMCAWQRSAG